MFVLVWKGDPIKTPPLFATERLILCPRVKCNQLSLLYLICFLDRTNIGNAKIADLPAAIGIDIKKEPDRFNSTLTIFFVSYALFEALCNFLLKKLRPSIFIPSIM